MAVKASGANVNLRLRGTAGDSETDINEEINGESTDANANVSLATLSTGAGFDTTDGGHKMSEFFGYAASGCTDIVDNYDPFDGNGVALYQLNGNTNDSSPNAYNGTWVGIPSYTTGIFGQSATFNGSSNYINIASNPLNVTQNFTLSGWSKTQPSDAYNVIFASTKTTDNTIPFDVIFLPSQNLIETVYNGVGYYIPFTDDGNWHHYLVTLKGTTLTTYIDGYFRDVRTVTLAPSSGNKQTIGARIRPNYQVYSQGETDQVRIFNTALDPLEVEALYTEQLCICGGTVDTLQVLGGVDTSCIATYQLDGNANDLSGNYSGTPTDVSYGVGEFDLAGVFNGSSSHIDFPSPIPYTNTDLTFSCWINLTSAFSSGYQTIVGAGNKSTGEGIIRLLIRYDSSNSYKIEPVRAYSGNSYYTNFAYPAQTINAGTWYNIVYTYSATGNTAKIYLNKSLVSTTSLTITSTDIVNSGVLALGQYRDSTGFFNGSIDQVRIFNKALNSTEVNTLYNETACGYTYPTFDLRSYGYNSAEDYDYSAISPYAIGLFFKPDGTKAFWSQSNTNKIEQISLSTAWDVSTATAGTSKTASGNGNCRGAWMNNDGTKYYHTTPIDGKIYEYTLSTAWDTSTATNTYTYTHGNGTNNTGVCFNYDGTKMYVSLQGTVFQYSLSTPWSTATASYDSKSLSMGISGSEQSWDMYITEDGTKFFNIIQVGDLRLDEYDLSTPYDISTGSKVRTFDYAPFGGNSIGFYFKPDGSKLYIAVTSPAVIKTFDLR